jgi:hypothetical protein
MSAGPTYTARAMDLLNAGHLPGCEHGKRWIGHGWKFCPECMEALLAASGAAPSDTEGR